MEAFEPLGSGRGIRVERGAWARKRWGWSCGACVMGEPELHDLVDLGEFFQRQRDFELAKEGLSRILLKGIGDSGEQRRLRSDVLGNDSEELGWRASAGRPGANWKRRIRVMLRRRR